MKIYTKTGDKGLTSLLTGKRVPKHHPRIDAYGTVDELNSFIGLLLAYEIDENNKKILKDVQHLLFTIGANLAMDESKPEYGVGTVAESDIQILENEMDRMNTELPPLRAFIIPGGEKAVSLCHVCRSICRRCERIVTLLSENESVDNQIIVFLNRLSDYLFVLARKIAFDQNIDIPVWENKKK